MRRITMAVAALLYAASVQAQGVSVYSHGGCPLARSGAGVADPCRDGSAIFFNPAALAAQPGVASMGTLVLFTSNEFTFDGGAPIVDSTQPAEWAPSAWIAARIGRLAAGVGAWAPYGLSTKWPLSFEGRFVGYDNTLRGIYIQPTLAYEAIPGKLALGAGLSVVSGSVRLHRRIDLASTNIPGTDIPFSALGVPSGTDFADTDLDVDDWSATFNVGVQVQPGERWAIGVRYLHTTKLDLSGFAKFRQIATGILLPPNNPLGLPAGTPLDLVLAPAFLPGATLGPQHLTTELTFPNQLVAGVRYQALSTLRILLDYQWTGWSQFDEARLDFAFAPAETLFLDFRNTSTARLGADYDVNDHITARAGISWSEAATPQISVTPLLAEGERVSLTAGLGYQLSRLFTAHAGFEVVFQEDRRGSVRPRTSRAQPDLSAGVYQSRAYVLGATISYRLPDLRRWLRPVTTDQ